MRWLFATFLALDLLGSALSGGAPWQTISARLAKGRMAGSLFCKIVGNATDWVALHAFGERDHCTASFEYYEARLRAVVRIQ